MKFKNALSLKFSFMFALIIFIILAGIYIWVEQNRSKSFFTKLDERALIAGQFYFAEDNLSKNKFKQVIKKFPQSLSAESISIYTDKFQPTFPRKDSLKWSKSLLKTLIKKKNIHFFQQQKQVSGLYFEDNSGNFLIMVSAIDEQGLEDLKQLRMIMSVFFFVSIFITFFIGRFFAIISLQPLVRITQNLKRIRASNLDMRLPINRKKIDEIDNLSFTINQLLEHLEQSFDSQKSFVANASHELRTPLTSILVEAEITLMKDRTPEVYKHALSEIVTSVENLNLIINSLIELMQTNLNHNDFQQILIDELMWEILDELAAKIEVNYNLPADMEKRTLIGNRRLLFIAISNIIKNAVKFSNDEVVKCEVEYKNKGINITITDQGIGIAAEDIEKIFQPFYRSNNAFKFKGYGIGLSLTNNIIKLHNGSIKINSKLNEGTTVSLYFPVD